MEHASKIPAVTTMFYSAIVVGSHLAAAGNKVTNRWVPAPSGVKGSEVADLFAKDAATVRAPGKT